MFILTLTMVTTSAPLSSEPTSVMAATESQVESAQQLYELGLFMGVGADASGNPIFALDDSASRAQGIVMLIRLLGKEGEALRGAFRCPFVDVPEWALPYIAYAYENGLTRGVSDTSFDPDGAISAAQFLTFILRSLGYKDGSDFDWESAWNLTDKLGVTNGQFNANNSNLMRGDIAQISFATLKVVNVRSGNLLIEDLVKANAVSATIARAIIESAKNSSLPSLTLPFQTPRPTQSALFQTPTPTSAPSSLHTPTPTPTRTPTPTPTRTPTPTPTPTRTPT
ncbi:MAG: S-layer homology domain-containing protein, partial [Oscillospiraceae bacterium]|nr:S-layer homology domain-containing protein [Oscillospiraceae bacterium]